MLWNMDHASFYNRRARLFRYLIATPSGSNRISFYRKALSVGLHWKTLMHRITTAKFGTLRLIASPILARVTHARRLGSARPAIKPFFRYRKLFSIQTASLAPLSSLTTILYVSLYCKSAALPRFRTLIKSWSSRLDFTAVILKYDTIRLKLMVFKGSFTKALSFYYCLIRINMFLGQFII